MMAFFSVFMQKSTGRGGSIQPLLGTNGGKQLGHFGVKFQDDDKKKILLHLVKHWGWGCNGNRGL